MPAKKPKEERQPGRGRRARNTVRDMVAVLRTLLNHAVDVDQLLDINQAARFGKRFFDGPSSEHGIHVEVYEEAELATILKAARELFPAAPYELYIRTLFLTGCTWASSSVSSGPTGTGSAAWS